MSIAATGRGERALPHRRTARPARRGCLVARGRPPRPARQPSRAADLGRLAWRHERADRRAVPVDRALAVRGGARGYPEGLKEAFGIGQLNTLEAYLHAEMFSLVVPVAVAVFAIRCASASIAAAEERGYLATVLSAPLLRRALVAGAFMTAALAIPCVLAVCGGLSLAVAALSGQDLSVGQLAAAFVGVWALGLFFGGCAILAAGWSHRSAPVTAAGVGLLVVMYVLDVVGKLADSPDWLRSLSALRYYGQPLQDGLSAAEGAGLVVAGALLATLEAPRFQRRDVLG